MAATLRRDRILASVLVCASLATVSVLAWAATPAERRTFLFRGHLDQDGVPVNQALDMVFKFYGPNLSTYLGQTYDVTAPGVTVANGEFAVPIPIVNSTLLNTDPLFVQVVIGGVALQPAQRIYAVPFAMAGRGDPFRADGRVRIGQDGEDTPGSTRPAIGFQTDVGDDAAAGRIVYRPSWDTSSLGIVGAGVSPSRKIHLWDQVEVNGTVSAAGFASRGSDFQLGTADGRFVGSVGNQRALVHGDADELLVNYAGDFEGGTRVMSGVTVDGATHLKSNLTVGGIIQPAWDSKWKRVQNGRDYAWPHGLGVTPQRLELRQCGAANEDTTDPCRTVTINSNRGYQDGYSYINPVVLFADDTNVYVTLSPDWWAWGIWTNAKGWHCPADDDNSCWTGYYRVTAWR